MKAGHGECPVPMIKGRFRGCGVRARCTGAAINFVHGKVGRPGVWDTDVKLIAHRADINLTSPRYGAFLPYGRSTSPGRQPARGTFRALEPPCLFQDVSRT